MEDLALNGHPAMADDQNLYIFCGLRLEYQPLVAPLTRGAPISVSKLSDFLVSQDFIYADDGIKHAPVVMTARCSGRGGGASQSHQQFRGQQQQSFRGSGRAGGTGSVAVSALGQHCAVRFVAIKVIRP